MKDIIENCFTCKNRISKTYNTIRCKIWTEKLRNWLILDNPEKHDPMNLVGRLYHEIKC